MPPFPRAAAALFDLAAADPSLHAAALGKSAHVRLDAGSAGELMLHLRVRDGVADVRVDGAAARAVDIRSDEIRTALAGEGLALGRFESAATPDGGRTPTMPTDGQAATARSLDPAIDPAISLAINLAIDRANATSALPVSFAHDGARTADTAPMGSDATIRSGFGSGADFGSQPRDPQARDPHDSRDPAARALAPARPTPAAPGAPDGAPSQPRGSRGLHVTA